uniref:Uncharacterized protein n=1 Tax=Romanomermis culicivorax TaxID=13658 RepID=A0A915HJX2_ROMCU
MNSKVSVSSQFFISCRKEFPTFLNLSGSLAVNIYLAEMGKKRKRLRSGSATDLVPVGALAKAKAKKGNQAKEDNWKKIDGRLEKQEKYHLEKS